MIQRFKKGGLYQLSVQSLSMYPVYDRFTGTQIMDEMLSFYLKPGDVFMVLETWYKISRRSSIQVLANGKTGYIFAAGTINEYCTRLNE